MTLFSKYLITAIAAVTATLTGVAAHADVTTLTFEIVNNTSGPLKLNRSNWNLALAEPGFFDVDAYSKHSYEANYKTNFGYPRKTPATLREVISYANGNRELHLYYSAAGYPVIRRIQANARSHASASATSTGMDDVKCEKRGSQPKQTKRRWITACALPWAEKP